MNRVFILGAGFSKAVADLPLCREMVSRIQVLIAEDATSDDLDRRQRAAYIRDFLSESNNRLVTEPMLAKGFRVSHSDLFEDFELLMTILDLDSTWDRLVEGFDSEGRNASWMTGRMSVATQAYPRHFIEDYIYRVLWRDQVRWELLSKFLSHLRNGDTVVSLNYDMLLDRAMYEEQLWHPADGYGIDRFDPIPRWKRTPFESQISLLKLHGSLNWDIEGDSLMLHSFRDANTPYFVECVEDHDPLNIRRPPWSGFGILPSLSKTFDSPPLLGIWRAAHSALERADEIVIIGYSVPEGDGAIWTLLATSIKEECEVSLYAKDDAKQVSARLARITGRVPLTSDQGLQAFVNRLQRST